MFSVHRNVDLNLSIAPIDSSEILLLCPSYISSLTAGSTPVVLDREGVQPSA